MKFEDLRSHIGEELGVSPWHEVTQSQIDQFAELARDLEVGMVVVTHNRSLAARADRVLSLADGRLILTDAREGVA